MPNRINYSHLLDKINKLKETWMWDHVIAIDPSGNFKNGKGHIGICIMSYNKDEQYVMFDETYFLKDFDDVECVMNKVMELVQSVRNTKHVVIENYIDYGKSATKFQEPETYYVVKALTERCKELGLQVSNPIASEHKSRFTNKILKQHGVDISKLSTKHSVDALRMCLYWYMFKMV